MKKLSILALTLMLAVTFAACSSTSETTKTAEPVKKVEPVKVDPKVTCKADADKTFEACNVAAGKDKKKAAACTTAKTKAYADCDKTKTAEPVKKEEPAKKAVKK